jgi:two-component system chemotaxis response regulator CheB
MSRVLALVLALWAIVPSALAELFPPFRPKPGRSLKLGAWLEQNPAEGRDIVRKAQAAASARIRRTLRLTERVRHQIRGAGLASRPRPSRVSPPPVAKTGKAGMKPGSAMLPGLVLIGTSTGGPAALDTVLPQLPADFPWPILVAQHLPASFTGPFAKRLNRECHLDVVEVNQPMPLKPGTIYIGKGDAESALRIGGIVAPGATDR